MESTQFYKYTTLAMLLLNLILLGFFFLGMPPSGQRAIHSLQMDEAQHTAFVTSAKRHGLLMSELTKKQNDLLKPYFQQLIRTNDKVNEALLMEAMHEIENQKIKITYEHFKEVKDVLKGEQMDNFESFMNLVLEKMLSERGKKSHPPKEF